MLIWGAVRYDGVEASGNGSGAPATKYSCMYLLLSRYTKPLAEVDRHLVAHRTFLDRYYASGDLIVSGPMDPREGGVIIANTMPRERLDAILAEDPFVRAGVSEYRVIEFHAARRHAALAELVALQ